jgi:hypothetical protein
MDEQARTRVRRRSFAPHVDAWMQTKRCRRVYWKDARFHTGDGMRTILALTAAASLVAAALPAQGHDHAHPTSAPAASASTASGDAEVERVRQATARYRDIDVARREGYRLFGMEGPLVGEHWVPSRRRAPAAGLGAPLHAAVRDHRRA